MANAAPVKMANFEKAPVLMEQLKAQTVAQNAYRVDANGNKISRKNVKRNALPSDVKPYLGYWKWEGDNSLSGVVLPTSGLLSIEQHPVYADSLLITGFDQFADAAKGGLTGYFANGRVYIPNQQTLPEGTNYNEGYATYFINYTLRNMTQEEKDKWEQEHPGQSSEGYGYTTMAPREFPFFFALTTTSTGEEVISSVYYADPDAQHTDAVLRESWSSAIDCAYDIIDGQFTIAGYYLYITHVLGARLEIFEFDPNEWTEAGTAQFMDAWFSELWADQNGNQLIDKAYDVPLYRSTLSPNRYLLLDPYGPTTPYGEYGINADPSKEGYLIFDIVQDPNIVLFEPFVYAVTMDMSNDPSVPDMEDFYCYNMSGLWYFAQNAELSRIEALLLDRGRDPSYYEASERRVYIYNGLFDMLPEGSLTDGYAWNGASMSGYVQLPENFDSVETIIGEDSNAPVKYYNIQGVRVLNPQPGQLVIKKQGNKATKLIVR